MGSLLRAGSCMWRRPPARQTWMGAFLRMRQAGNGGQTVQQSVSQNGFMHFEKKRLPKTSVKRDKSHNLGGGEGGKLWRGRLDSKTFSAAATGQDQSEVSVHKWTVDTSLSPGSRSAGSELLGRQGPPYRIGLLLLLLLELPDECLGPLQLSTGLLALLFDCGQLPLD